MTQIGDMLQTLAPIRGVLDEHAAAVTCCAHATDLEDARELLRACGLIPDPLAKGTTTNGRLMRGL